MIRQMTADIISYLRAICQYKIHADSIEAKREQTVFDGLTSQRLIELNPAVQSTLWRSWVPLAWQGC